MLSRQENTWEAVRIGRKEHPRHLITSHSTPHTSRQEEALNPIQQDLTSNGSLRYYHSDIPWNYGLLPQTWEDPDYLNPDVNATVRGGSEGCSPEKQTVLLMLMPVNHTWNEGRLRAAQLTMPCQ